jgi:PAS domain S-box-containing protein
MIADVRTILNNVAEIWIIVDTNGTVSFVSKHTEKFKPIIRPWICEGSSIFDSIPESWQDLAKNVLKSLLSSGAPSSLEASFTDDEGKELYFQIKCSGIRDSNGKVTEIFIEARDVTPQKIFEKKITIVAREYQSVIENANAVIIGNDSRGYITEWNEMAAQVTGYSKNESYIQKLSDFLLCRECHETFSHAMNNVLKGEVITNYEMIIHAKDQRKLTLLINATPRKSATSEVIGILLIGQDITELSAYRQSLEQKVLERTNALKSALENEKELVEVKDRFVSMASHEFRSPISYIHRNIEAMKVQIEKLSAKEIRGRLEKIQSQAEHLSSLLEDVLTIGKSGASKIKGNMKCVDLNEFFTRIIDEVQSNTHHTHLIQLDFSEPSLQIESDENLLRNIFVNLLTNAIKFSPGEKDVFLSVGVQGHMVEFIIKDKGMGIEEKDLSRIFEPFHRGENVQKIKGTGLGLPIVKKAVETLGGEVKVQSKTGQGTSFTIQLNKTRNP